MKKIILSFILSSFSIMSFGQSITLTPNTSGGLAELDINGAKVGGFSPFKLNSGTSSLRLQTNGIDRLYITPNGGSAPLLPGNVGIGTLSPPAKLTVAGDLALRKIVRETSAGGYNDYDRQEASIAIFENGGTIGGIQGGSQGQILYVLCGYGNNQSALTIRHESAGNPTAANRILTHTGADFVITAGAGGVLLIYDDTKARWRIVETPSGSGTAGWGLTGNSGTNPATQFIGTTDAQPLAFKTNNVERMRILSNGNVGIGTSTPTSFGKLHVFNGDAGSVAAIQYSAATFESDNHTYLSILSPANKQGAIVFGSPNGNSDGFITYNHSSNSMGFFTNNNSSVALHLSSTGNVGIGTTFSPVKLEVAGDYAVSGKVEITASTNNLNRNGKSVIKVSGGGPFTLTGIAGGVDGMMVHIYVTQGTDLIIAEDSGLSSAGNKIETDSNVDITISQGGGATLMYDGDVAYWRVIGFKQ